VIANVRRKNGTTGSGFEVILASTAARCAKFPNQFAGGFRCHRTWSVSGEKLPRSA